MVKLELPMLLRVFDEPLIVLLVSVCDPLKVATVESIAIVTGAEPLNDVPDNPVPMVKVDVVLAVTVVEPPRLTVLPLMVIELFCRPLFWIAELIAEAGMLIVAFAAVVS